MADGRPVPEWISVDPQGLILVERPADIEEHNLRITALLDDGSSITRAVEIQAISGEIQPGEAEDPERAALFSEQIGAASTIYDSGAEELGRALAQ